MQDDTVTHSVRLACFKPLMPQLWPSMLRGRMLHAGLAQYAPQHACKHCVSTTQADVAHLSRTSMVNA
jgi:hypothetical protein